VSYAHETPSSTLPGTTASAPRGGFVPASTIVLIDADAAAAEAIGKTLTGVGYTVDTFADQGDAFGKIAEHHLVIIDQVGEKTSAVDVCREIRGTPALASVPVLCISQSNEVEDRIRFLEAGADDVIARPFDDRELEARVEALLLRFQRSKDLGAVVSADGVVVQRARRVVAVHSPKGGVGTTTIATNIAAAMAKRKPDRVVLIDLALQFGQVSTHLNMEPKFTLVDIVRDEGALREHELLRTYALRHDSGLHIVAAPPTPELAEIVTPEHVNKLLETILDEYDAVVVDAGSWIDDRTLAVFEHADAIVLPVNREISTLKALHILLDYLSENGSAGAKASFVLNNQFARETLRNRDVESALGAKVAVELPYDPFLYIKAVNEGIPVVIGAPRSAPAEQLEKLAESMFGPTQVVPPVTTAPEPKRKGLFAGLRRS
jgi:pilus assembly protein CpaE